MDRLSKRKFGIVCHGKVVRIPLEGDEILQVHDERTQGVMKTLMNTKHQCRLLRREAWSSFEVSVGITEEGEVVTYLRFIANFSKIVKPLTSLTERNQKVKLRRVRAMSMTIQSGVMDKILATSCETPKVENAPAEMLRDMDQQMERGQLMVSTLWIKLYSEYEYEIRYHPVWSKRNDTGSPKCGVQARERIRRRTTWFRSTDGKERRRELVFYGSYLGSIDNSKEWNSGDDQLRLNWMIYLMVLADAAESALEDIMRECVIDFGGSYHSSIRCAPFEALYGRKLSLKEKFKAVRDRQRSYAGNRRPFEILERIGPVAYRLRLPEELSGVHDTFHVSNLKKCLADASLHVPLNEIKVDKTLRFIKEPVEILDREIKSLKRSKISLVKVRWDSKRGLEFTWERKDYMKSKYPQLFVDRADESAN
ncbi:hypothetical protein Tco_1428639 [Tanacetum coccineum]